MYEKTLTIGTAKVNNAYEWQKVSCNKNQQQQKLKQKPNINKSINTTKPTKTTNATKPTTPASSVTVSTTPPASAKLRFKFSGYASRRQTLAHQIKRAHRHLLTGNDKLPTLQQQTKPTTTNKSRKQQHTKHLLKNSDKQQKHKTKNSHHRPHKANRNCSRPCVTGSSDQDPQSGLSSRWSSIECSINVLEDLLYYCDEEAELYVAQLYERYQQLTCSEYESGSEEQEQDEEFWSDCDVEVEDNMSHQSLDDDAVSSSSGAGTNSTNSASSPLVPSSLRRRGHQHHPRFSGTRKPQVPNVQEILAALYRGDSKGVLSNLRGETSSSSPPPPSTDHATESLPAPDSILVSRSTLSLPLSDSVTNSLGSNSPTPTDESSVQDESTATPTTATTTTKPLVEKTTKKKKREKGDKTDKDKEKGEKSEKKKKSSSKRDRNNKRPNGANIMEASSDSLATDGGGAAIDEGIALTEDDDTQAAEWSKLRCTSESAEVVAEREARRNKGRCADYPGLAFGRSIFSSDTMMKFNIIRNELHNIMNTQLKRAESEVAALNRRIQLLEEDLERSEERLGSATAKLSEASQAADESERIRKALENRTNMEDDKVALLENQLAQAKLIAEEADKKYEEVARKLVLMEQDLERSEEKVELSESKIVELEEELRVVGNNLKSLEVSEEKANQREEEYKNQIKTLNTRLKEAEARAEFAERSVQKLQKEVDRLEDELINEKERYALVEDSLDFTFVDLMGIEPFYNDRNPKPPTPEPTEEDLARIAAAEAAKAAAQAAAEEAALSGGDVGADGVEGAAPVANGEAVAPAEEVVPAEPVKEPTPPPPPPFEYAIDLPPEGAEVPYVKNCEAGDVLASLPTVPEGEEPPPEGAPAAPTEGVEAVAAAPTAETPADAAVPPTGEAPPAEAAAAAPPPNAEEAAPPTAEAAPQA
ncbi:golgin candidate 5 isoform X2 [Drosophila willistoni]|nr:golgin candidate 5 isoform X2 [Drosophila willistoni]